MLRDDGSSAAEAAAEAFCDITASCISAVLFLRFTPKLLDTRCKPSVRQGTVQDQPGQKELPGGPGEEIHIYRAGGFGLA